MNPTQDQFFAEVKKALAEDVFIDILLTKPVDPDGACRRVTGTVKEIRQQPMLQLLFMEETRHVTKNFAFEEGLAELATTCGSAFRHAILYTTEGDHVLRYGKGMKVKLSRSKPTKTRPPPTDHDRIKPRIVDPATSLYLHPLGITTREGTIAHSMEDKFRQIDRYIQTFDAVYRKSDLAAKKSLSVADMGCGKGYLTFALYDFLRTQKGIDCSITGVESRQHLVDFCNEVAGQVQFEDLRFVQGDIASFKPTALDVLIALHACDTATDDAIAAGIEADASIIITAPCCHKQVRKAMDPTAPLSAITRHGIFMERQAELVTDTIRALLLDAHGYETTIHEFIADAHTHKNVMIVAIKSKKPPDKASIQSTLDRLKTTFGVKEHQLETRLQGRSKT